MVVYPVTKQQIHDSYNLVKNNGRTHGEAILILWEFYDHAFGLTSYKFREYLMEAIGNDDPIEAYDRAMAGI